MLNKKSVDDINVKGKRVLVRCDFNVPLQDGKITDESRLVAALPTIKKLVADGGKIILCSHLGKPKGEPKPELSLAPVAKRLTELLGQEVKFVPSPVVVDDTVKAAVADMKDGEIKYSMFCNDNGGIIDDFIVYRCAADNYWLVVNAGNREKDAAWVESHLSGDVDYRDEGNDWGQIALQGPKSGDILKKLCDEQYIPAKYYTFTEDVPLNLGERTIHALVSQTGYTGEYGFEIYCKAEDTVDLWKALLKAGEPEGVIPRGLGARDTLRLEASMPLYGHEMNDEITPKMAGLPCKLTGKDFIGRDALVALGAPKMKRIGMKVVGRGIVREHCDLYTMDGEKIGWASSGTFAPYIGCGVAMGYIPAQDIKIGKHLNADVRGRMVELEIVPMPFYKLER